MKLNPIDKGYIPIHGPEIVISMIYKNNYHVPNLKMTLFFHILRDDIRFGVFEEMDLKRRVTV